MDRFEKTPRAQRKWFTYRGLLVCGECGRAITAGEHVKYYPGTNRHVAYVYYHCTKSGGAQSCSQLPLREEILTEQLADQIRPVELTSQEHDLLRDILKESHADEQMFRDEQLSRLHRLKTEVQRKQDVLLDRLLDGTIPKQVYEARLQGLEEERQGIEVSIVGHEEANRSYFQQMENFLDVARSIHRVFLAGSPRQKREVVQLVALNVSLEGRKARLNLKRPAQILADRERVPYGVTDGI